jgi:hypothetical protein
MWSGFPNSDAYNYITKLCSKQAQINQDHENNVRKEIPHWIANSFKTFVCPPAA